MSYDLMVFDPDAAPLERDAFLSWYDQQAIWSEEHGYDDPKVSTAGLRAWFLDMITEYPAMNGLYAVDDPDNPKLTDYSVGSVVIYAASSWSQASQARAKVLKLAKEHSVGFFDVSSKDYAIWRPGSKKECDTFYCFYATDESVPADQPIPVAVDRVSEELVEKMVSDSDFIGLIDCNGTTLQFMYHLEENRFWVEIPSPEAQGSYGAYMSRDALIQKLCALPEVFEASSFPELQFESWNQEE